MAAILNSAILDSAILVFTLKLTHIAKIGPHHLHIKNFTHSFWLNLMMGAILKFYHVEIQTLPSWIQTPCYLLSDLLKNTLTPLWLWLNIIQSDSTSFILT